MMEAPNMYSGGNEFHDPAIRGPSGASADHDAYRSQDMGNYGERSTVTLPNIHSHRGASRAGWSGDTYIPRRLNGTEHATQYAVESPYKDAQEQRGAMGTFAPIPGVPERGQDYLSHGQGLAEAQPPMMRAAVGTYSPRPPPARIPGENSGQFDRRASVPRGELMRGDGTVSPSRMHGNQLSRIGAEIDRHVTQYQSELQRLQSENDEMYRKNNALHARVEADAYLAQKLYETQQGLSASTKEVEVCRVQIDERQRRVDAVEASLAAMTSARDEVQKYLAAVTQQHADAAASAKNFEAQLSAEQARGATLEQTAHNATEAWDATKTTLEEELASKSTALTEALGRITELEATLAGTTQQLESIRVECNERAAELSALQQTSTAAEKHATEQVSDARKQAARSQAREVDLEAKLSAANDQITQLEGALVDAKNALAAQSEAAASKALELTTALEAVTVQITSLTDATAAAKHVEEERDRLETTTAELEGLLARRAETMEAMETSHAALRDVHEQCEREYRAFLDQINVVTQVEISSSDGERQAQYDAIVGLLRELSAKNSASSGTEVSCQTEHVTPDTTEFRARLQGITEVLVRDIASVTLSVHHSPLEVRSSLQQLLECCRQGDHSEGEDDAWIWDNLNTVVRVVVQQALSILDGADGRSVNTTDSHAVNNTQGSAEASSATDDMIGSIQERLRALLALYGPLDSGEEDSEDSEDSMDVDGLVSKLGAACAVLNSKRMDADVHALDCQQKHENCQQKHDDAVAAMAALKQQHGDETKLLNMELQQRAQQLTTLADELRQHNVITANDSTQQKEMVEQLTRDHNELQDRNWSQEARILDLEGEVLHLRATLDATTQALTDTVDKLEGMRLPDDVAKELAERDNTIAALRAQLSDVSGGIYDTLKEANHVLQRERDAAVSAREAALAAQSAEHVEAAKDLAVAKSVQEKLEHDRDELEAKLRELAEADAMTEALLKEKSVLEQALEGMQEEMRQQKAKIGELEEQLQDMQQKAIDEIEKRTANANGKVKELEFKVTELTQWLKETRTKLRTAEALVMEQNDKIEALEKDLRIAQSQIANASNAEEVFKATYRLGMDRYASTVQTLTQALHVELGPLQRNLIEDPIDPEEDVKDTWDPHCDNIDRVFTKGISSLHEAIADIPNQLAAVRKEEGDVRDRMQRQHERVVEQMKLKMARKDATLEALNAQLGQLDEVQQRLAARDVEVDDARKEVLRLKEKIGKQREAMTALDAQLAEEKALKDALVKRLEMAQAKSMTRTSTANHLRA